MEDCTVPLYASQFVEMVFLLFRSNAITKTILDASIVSQFLGSFAETTLNTLRVVKLCVEIVLEQAHKNVTMDISQDATIVFKAKVSSAQVM